MKTYINRFIAIVLSMVLLCSVNIVFAKGKVETITINKTMQYTFDWANDDFQHWYKFVPPITGTYTAKTFTKDEAVRNDSGAISIAILNASEETIVEGLWSDLSLKATAKAKLTKGKTYYIYIEYWQEQQIPMSTNITLNSLNLTAPKISKLTPAKKQFKATWNPLKNIEGYQIQYATDSKFTKNKKTVTVSGAKSKTKTVKKLKGNKKYFVRIRSYKTFNNKKYYSSWSKAKTVKTKK
ncbi:MAG: hypothetical protein IJ731_06780 [Eubacterium sp.]|nr:hypothetical protein [Eubacterium sp.]